MIIYTDGACSANGTDHSSGGYAVVVFTDDNKYICSHSKHCDGTSNNREELKAILFTLLKYGHLNPIVYSDSAYAINTLTTWMFNWESNGWIKADGRKPENLDLIQPFFKYWQKGFRIQLKKVKGHSGNLGNEMADKLATGMSVEEVENKYIKEK